MYDGTADPPIFTIRLSDRVLVMRRRWSWARARGLAHMSKKLVLPADVFCIPSMGTCIKVYNIVWAGGVTFVVHNNHFTATSEIQTWTRITFSNCAASPTGASTFLVAYSSSMVPRRPSANSLQKAAVSAVVFSNSSASVGSSPSSLFNALSSFAIPPLAFSRARSCFSIRRE